MDCCWKVSVLSTSPKPELSPPQGRDLLLTLIWCGEVNAEVSLPCTLHRPHNQCHLLVSECRPRLTGYIIIRLSSQWMERTWFYRWDVQLAQIRNHECLDRAPTMQRSRGERLVFEGCFERWLIRAGHGVCGVRGVRQISTHHPSFRPQTFPRSHSSVVKEVKARMHLPLHIFSAPCTEESQ